MAEEEVEVSFTRRGCVTRDELPVFVEAQAENDEEDDEDEEGDEEVQPGVSRRVRSALPDDMETANDKEEEQQRGGAARTASPQLVQDFSFLQNYGGGLTFSEADDELIQRIEQECMERPWEIDCKDFKAIVGYDETKLMLEESLVLPIAIPEYMKGARRPWKGVLLFGFAGTGKTMLVKAVAQQVKMKLVCINIADVIAAVRDYGEAAGEILAFVFDLARHHAPAVLFVDQAEAMCGTSSGDVKTQTAMLRVKKEMQAQMDIIQWTKATRVADDTDARSSMETVANPPHNNDKVVLVAACSRPWELDRKLIKRLEKRIHMPLPVEQDRYLLLEHFFTGRKQEDRLDTKTLVDFMDGYTYQDIEAVCLEALEKGSTHRLVAKNNRGVRVFMLDCLNAVQRRGSSIRTEELQKMKGFLTKHGCT